MGWITLAFGIGFVVGIGVTCATFMWACNDGGLETPFEPWWDQ